MTAMATMIQYTSKETASTDGHEETMLQPMMSPLKPRLWSQLA